MNDLTSGQTPHAHRTLDVITFGETMGLFYPPSNGRLRQGNNVSFSFGGAESNVAIALARLGCKSGWFSLLGDDPIGHMIHTTLRGEGVDVSQVQFTKDAPTGIMIREQVRGKTSVYYYRSHSAARLLNRTFIDPTYIAKGKFLHLTGITSALSESCAEAVFEAVRLAKSQGVKVCFDPNIRLKLWKPEIARPVLLKLSQLADYFLPGFDELKLLFEEDDERLIIDKLLEWETTTVIKSVGKHNVIVANGNSTVIPFEEVERVIDPVGAGDAFTGGLLCGLVNGFPIEDAVRFGGIVGALSIQQEGDWEALPSLAEVNGKRMESGYVER